MAKTDPEKVECFLCGAVSQIYRDKETESVYCPVCQLPIRYHKTIPLGDLNLRSCIEKSIRRMVVVFWAPYDIPSRTMKEHLDEMVPEFPNIVLASVDVSCNPEVQQHFGIQFLPSLLVFERGKMINRVMDALSPFELYRILSEGTI